MIVAIPLTVKLVQTQQQLKSKATGNEITCPKLTQDAAGNCLAKDVNLELVLDSPYGSPSPSPSP